jgi:hypothetical protein
MAKEHGVQIPDPRTGVEGNIRGEETELFVATVLQTIPDVQSIHRTEQHGEDDKNGFDLFVHFDTEHSPIDRVGVQVKSSQAWIRRFRRDLRRRHNLQPEELSSWMRDHKMIVLNGRLPEDAVKHTFNEQLQGIVEHNKPTNEIQIFPTPKPHDYT